MTDAVHLAVVSACGAAGCALRVLVRDALVRRGTQPWWSTCAINLSGALAMGAVMGCAGAADPEWRSAAIVAVASVLAGWTTYSAFAMDVVQLWLRGARAHAIALWGATLVGAPAAAFAGAAMVHALSGGAA